MRQRRQRTNFNEETIDALDVYFTKNPYPDINERESIAKELHTSEDRIQVWFQNKRARYRKKMVKVEKTIDTTNESISLTPAVKKSSQANKKGTIKNKANLSLESVQSPKSDLSVCSQSSPELLQRSIDYSSSFNDSCYGSFNQSYASNMYDISRTGLQNYSLNVMPYASMGYSTPYNYCTPYFKYSTPYYGANFNCFNQASPVLPTSLHNADNNFHKERVTKPFFRPYE